MKGKVKWFNDAKGYGFIAGEDGQEYYVHSSMLGANVFLKEGNAVNFEPKTSEKGLQANTVTLVQDEQAQEAEVTVSDENNALVQETAGTVDE